MPRPGRPARISVLLACVAALLATATAGAARADDHGGDAAHATAIAPGQTGSGSIFPGGDQDWFKVVAAAGDDWTFRTTSPWPTDTTLRLIDKDGRTQLAFDDDGGGGRASRIVWRAPSDGTYYVNVGHYDWRWGIGRFTLAASVVPAAALPPTGGASLALDAAPVFDPRLEDATTNGVAGHAALEVTLRVDPAGSYVVDLDVRSASGARVATILSASPATGGVTRTVVWDGAAPIGPAGASVPVDPGPYKLRLAARPQGAPATSAPLAVREREVRVVRLGAAKISLTAAPGAGAESDYVYHKSGGVRGRFRPVLAADPEWQLGGVSSADPGDLDRADGRARPAPQPWTDTAIPPSGGTYSLPAVFTAGSRVQATVTLGERPVSAARPGSLVAAGYPVANLPIRVFVNGWSVGPVGGGPPPARGIAPGERLAGPLSGPSSPPLPSSIGRGEVVIRFTFEAQESGVWRSIPGEQTARVRVYTILGATSLAPGGVAAGIPYVPWLAAVDLVSATVAPGAQDEALVADRVSDHVFASMGLSYDLTSGSPAYAIGNLDDLELDLSGFLDRASGSRVNCADCATISATLVNMVGGDVDYAICGYNFALNYLLPIGGSAFTNDPFRQGFGAFAFHAVATRDGALTIHDSCLSVDVDGTPWSPPHIEGRPRGMQFDAYRAALTPDPVPVQLVRRARLR